MSMELNHEKTIDELTKKELYEDLDYYLTLLHIQIPPFADKTLDILKDYIQELKKRDALE